MKSIILSVLFCLMLILPVSVSAQSSNGQETQVQENQPAPKETGWLKSKLVDMKDWIKGGSIALVLGAFLGFLKKRGWTQKIDLFAKLSAKYSHKIGLVLQCGGEAFLKLSDTAQKVDDAIAEDGSTDLNTLKEALELGKQVKVELEDMVVLFKPKK